MHKTNDRERGSVLTEMAVCIPVVLLILIGAVDFARAWVHANATSNAAHAGAQFGAQNIAHAGNTKVIKDVVMRDLEASSMMKAIVDAQDGSPTVADFSVESERYCMCDGGTEVDCDSGSCGLGGASQMHVRVRVNSTFEPLFNYPGLPEEIRVDRVASLRAR